MSSGKERIEVTLPFQWPAGNEMCGIAPGANLLDAPFRKSSTALILIDEWIAEADGRGPGLLRNRREPAVTVSP